MQCSRSPFRRPLIHCPPFHQSIGLLLLFALVAPVHASNHLDTKTVQALAGADIGDLYAWTSQRPGESRRLNLAMTIVGNQFSNRLQYVFHVDSAPRFGDVGTTTEIVCRFDAASALDCWAGDVDALHGEADEVSRPVGVTSRGRRFRAFAGLRDDPFFNNLKGTRAALGVAVAALSSTERPVPIDAGGCPAFDAASATAMREQLLHSDGGPGANFLAGWSTAALVVSIDVGVVDGGGPLLAVWSTVHQVDEIVAAAPAPRRPLLGKAIERVGRPLIANGFVKPLAPEAANNARKEEYNAAPRSAWSSFAGDIRETIAVYDGFDGVCGNQWLADAKAAPSSRYAKLAAALADDRLWIDSRAPRCETFLALEKLALDGAPEPVTADCGGRTPNYDTVDEMRSLLVADCGPAMEDGVAADDGKHSVSEFPFLAAPLGK
jgi:hypothetical protein